MIPFSRAAALFYILTNGDIGSNFPTSPPALVIFCLPVYDGHSLSLLKTFQPDRIISRAHILTLPNIDLNSLTKLELAVLPEAQLGGPRYLQVVFSEPLCLVSSRRNMIQTQNSLTRTC